MGVSAKKINLREKIVIQARDIEIFKFLDKVGYSNLEHIAVYLGDGTEKGQAAILRRLYLLRGFDYLKVFSTHFGNYYALTRKSKLDLELINSIKLDQLQHHNFLIDLYFIVKHADYVLSEREVISKFKIVGKKGKIPDMLINDWVIEYERTNKSAKDCKEVIDYWTGEQGKKLCIIYETEEIKNRYEALLNPRVKLLARSACADILRVLADNQSLQHEFKSLQNSVDSEGLSTVDKSYIDNVKSKYM